METSIIVRVKNEVENLKELFEILKKQTYQDFEIVIVDNDSSDESDKIAYDYFPKDRVRIVRISNFSYPKACNLGAEKARGKYLVYLSAHSFPISNTWLSDGLSNFVFEKVAGVFAFPIAAEKRSLAEKVSEFSNRFKKGGELGNTNSIIRRELWEKHKFDEGLPESEDYEWSKYWKQKGYEIVNDPRFTVYHTHNLSLLGLIKRRLRWRKINKEIDRRLATSN